MAFKPLQVMPGKTTPHQTKGGRVVSDFKRRAIEKLEKTIADWEEFRTHHMDDVSMQRHINSRIAGLDEARQIIRDMRNTKKKGTK